MKKAKIFVNGVYAGELTEIEPSKNYLFSYQENYQGAPVSLEMPTSQLVYHYRNFPPFFEGLLPEGMMLEGLLRYAKLDRHDFMGQLITVGGDLIGNVTVEGV